MDIVSIAITIIIVGVLLWAANNYIPMEEKIKQLLNIVVVVFLVIWLLQTFGILGSIHRVQIH